MLRAVVLQQASTATLGKKLCKNVLGYKFCFIFLKRTEACYLVHMGILVGSYLPFSTWCVIASAECFLMFHRA